MSSGESEPAITQLLAVLDAHVMAPGMPSDTWACRLQKINRDRKPYFRASVRIRSDGIDKMIWVEMDNCESATETRIICDQIQHRLVGRKVSLPEPYSQRQVCEGRKCFSFSFDFSSNVVSMSIHLKIYATSKLPLSTLDHALNEARIRGDPQCDAFLCVEGVELPAHRLVLAAQSDVFSKMFDGNFKEALDGRVFLKDTTKKAAEQLLEYLYTGTGDYEGVELELLDLAERYALKDLKNDCILQLSAVSCLRALELLQTRSPHIEIIEGKLMRIVIDNWQESVRKTSQWKNFISANRLAACCIEITLKPAGCFIIT